MKRIVLYAAVGCLLGSWAIARDRDEALKQAWPGMRGPLSNGVAPHGDPPTHWSEGKNIRWKKPIPGHGLSTPVVFGDYIFIQTAVPVGQAADAAAEPAPLGQTVDAAKSGEAQPAQQPRAGEAPREPNAERGAGDGRPPREGRDDREGRGGEGRREGRGGREGGGRPRNPPPTDAYKFIIMALHKKTGDLVWEKTLREQVPHEGTHHDGSLAPASPVTDGEHVIAHFGSRGTYGLTMKGELLWEKDLGDMQTRNGFGEGSSPALHGDTVIVNWDHEGDSFIVALDKKTGAEKWRQARDEPTSWSTPLVIEDGGRTLAVVAATKRVRAYDLATGELRWECGGLGGNVTPSPVTDGELVFAMSGFRDDALLAISYKGAVGDITDSAAVAWKIDKGTPYVPSPLLYGDLLYFVQKNTEMLSCYAAKTGEPHYAQQRLDEINGIYASPVAAAGRVYVLGRNGATYVLKNGPKYEVLAVNKLDDEFSASPAIVGKDLFLRGHESLYCIGE